MTRSINPNFSLSVRSLLLGGICCCALFASSYADEDEAPKRPFYRLYNTKPKLSPALGLPVEEDEALDEDELLERGAIRSQDVPRSSPVDSLIPPPRMPEASRGRSDSEEKEEKSWITPDAFLLEEDRIESDEDAVLQEGPAEWKQLDEKFLEEAQEDEASESRVDRTDSEQELLEDLTGNGEEENSFRGSAEERSVLETQAPVEAATRNNRPELEVDRFQPVLAQSASGASVERDQRLRPVELSRSREAFSNLQTELPRFGQNSTAAETPRFGADAFSRNPQASAPTVIRHRAPSSGLNPVTISTAPLQGASLPRLSLPAQGEAQTQPSVAPVKPVDRSFFRDDDFRLKQ